ncbi:MAG: molybdenum cofactor biosynthesis protein MoaE [Hyphomicrobiales bacterium]|nr:molybdenum cofactor biosynthesis protein MoaE [Hyphomicrobiales bacterium]
MVQIEVRVQQPDFDTAAEIDRVAQLGGDTGAIVTFTGRCRSEGGRLAALEIEHYPDMADVEIGRIAEQAAGRWAVDALLIVHRYGVVAPGENIVLVIATAAHRRPAFAAADFLMDFLKTQAPFWKKERRADGGQWIEARPADDADARRWSTAGKPVA